MKKFKISFVAIFAIMLGIAGSAFTIKSNAKKLDTQYYYQFNSDERSDLFDETKWSPGSSPEGCSPTNDLNCVIVMDVAPDGNGHPDFDTPGINEQGELDAITVSWKEE